MMFYPESADGGNTPVTWAMKTQLINVYMGHLVSMS